ncbi:hypothetical protein SUDANB176_04220 [Streptomyces sp. enrichment culture]
MPNRGEAGPAPGHAPRPEDVEHRPGRRTGIEAAPHQALDAARPVDHRDQRQVGAVGGPGPDERRRQQRDAEPARDQPSDQLDDAGLVRDVADRAHAGARWVYLSPPALLEPGERTGRYRRGTDTLLTGADGRSWISAEDFAVAVVDELETPGPDPLVTVVHRAAEAEPARAVAGPAGSG